MSSVSKSAGAVPVHKSKAKAAQTRRGLLYALPDWLMIIVLFSCRLFYWSSWPALVGACWVATAA